MAKTAPDSDCSGLRAARAAAVTIVLTATHSAFAVLLIVVRVADAHASLPASGTICIAPVTEQMRKADPADPRGTTPRRQFNFSVQVDSGARVHVPAGEPLALRGLELRKTHLVRIFDGPRVVESFRFTFERKGNMLCLSYGSWGSWYATWDLSPPGRRSWCNCR